MTPKRFTCVCERCGKEFRATTGAAKRCLECRYLGRKGRGAKWAWTPARDDVLRRRYEGKVKGRAREIAKDLGFPTWAVKRRAAELGLTYPMERRDWTAEEEAFVFEHAGSRTPHWMAQKLNRTLSSVVLKIKRMKISQAWREGYTMRELELCFGCDHRVIEGWIRKGWLSGGRRGTLRKNTNGKGPGDPWVFTDAQILQFVKEHPTAFRLDKVDQVWFMDLMLSGGLIAKAIRDERSLGAAQ